MFAFVESTTWTILYYFIYYLILFKIIVKIYNPFVLKIYLFIINLIHYKSYGSSNFSAVWYRLFLSAVSCVILALLNSVSS